AVTVWLNWNGLPIASTHSPTLSCDESLHGITGRPLSPIFSSAMSVSGSVPTTFPLISRLSGSAIVISRMFWPTTWLFVTTYPSEEMMTPEPSDWERRARGEDQSLSPTERGGGGWGGAGGCE